MSTDDRGRDDETSARTEAEIREIVADELRAQQSNSTRRGVLKGAGLLGAAGLLGGTAGAQTGGGGGGASLDVGSVTQNTYRIAGNRYGGPAAGRSELTSELGGSDAGARFAADDTGAEYYWTGSAWEQLPVEAPAINTDGIDVTNFRKAADYVIYTDSGTAKAVNTQGAVAYSQPSGDVFKLINDINTDRGTPNNNAGRHFHFVSGTHEYATALDGWGDMQVSGEGLATTILKQSDGANLTYAIETVQTDQQQNFLQFYYLKLSGNAGNNTGTTGFHVNVDGTSTIRDIHWNHVFVDGFPQDGVHLKETWGHRYDNFLVENCGRDGIRLETVGQSLNQMHINNAYIARNAGWGINCVDSGAGSISDHEWRVVLSNNGIDGAAKGGAKLDKVLGGELDIITVSHQNASGVELESVDDAEVSINARNNPGGYGAEFTGACNGTVFSITGTSNANGLNEPTLGRCLVNGVGRAFGPPSGSPPWDGFVSKAEDLGGIVWDVSTDTKRVPWAARNSQWVPLAPYGPLDVGSLTGMPSGTEAISDGTNANATAYEKFIMNGSGDWQSIADPTTTITPS